MMKKIKGFTLIEFIVALTIGAIIIMGTGFILANGKKNQLIQMQKENMQRDATDLGNLLSRYTRSLGRDMCLPYDPPPSTSGYDAEKNFFSKDAVGFYVIQRGEFTTYTFKIRKSLTTEEQNSDGSVSGSAVDYFGLIDPNNSNSDFEELAPYVLASNCIDSINRVDDRTDINGQEIYAFDMFAFHFDFTPQAPWMRRNGGLVFVGTADGGWARPFFENVAAFDIYYAKRLSGTDFRDPADKWTLMDNKFMTDHQAIHDGSDPTHWPTRQMFTPDVVALKFVFTLQPFPVVQMAGEMEGQMTGQIGIDNKTFEVIAAVRNLDPWR